MATYNVSGIKRRPGERQEAISGWLMIAPALLLITVFMLVPTLISFGLAFTDQRLAPGPLPTQFVGLDNFMRLFVDTTFLQALKNNVSFTLVVVPLQCSLALLLAILVNQRLPGMRFFRAIYFSPVTIATVVAGVIWALLLNPQGMLNAALNGLSSNQIGVLPWLADTRLAMPAIIIVSIWSSAGFQMVIFLAGLQEISAELYDAAAIDGANTWQRLRYVTLPQLRNTTVFVVITTTILAFRLFTLVEVMTQGGPRGTTNTVVRYIVETGFRTSRIGYASAMTIVFLVIVLAVSVFQRRFIFFERM
jgi:multiple sugar transport system permease protein